MIKVFVEVSERSPEIAVFIWDKRKYFGGKLPLAAPVAAIKNFEKDLLQEMNLEYKLCGD